MGPEIQTETVSQKSGVTEEEYLMSTSDLNTHTCTHRYTHINTCTHTLHQIMVIIKTKNCNSKANSVYNLLIISITYLYDDVPL